MTRRERTPEDAALKRRVVALKRQRLSYRDIASELGVSVSTAHKLHKEALLEVPAQEVAQYREEELQLIDDAMRDLIVIASDTSVSERTRVEAWTSVRGWSEHRARIVGLNAPSRSVQTVITEDTIDAAIAKLSAEMAQNDPS